MDATDDQGKDHEDETMETGGPSVEWRRIAIIVLLILGAVFMGVVMWYEASHTGRMSIYHQNIEAIRFNLSFFRKRGQCRKSVMEADPMKQYMNCNISMGADTECTECPPGWGDEVGGGWALKYCFKIFKEKKDWQSARRACLDVGADLAVDLRYTNARDEIDTLVKGLFDVTTSEDQASEDQVWIGLNNLIRPDEFRWVNNIRLYEGKDEWKSEEEKANNYKLGTYDSTNHDRFYPLCAGIEKCGPPYKKYWRKLWCNSTRYFLCEKRAFNIKGPF